MKNTVIYNKYLFRDSVSGQYLVYNTKKQKYEFDNEVERAVKAVDMDTATMIYDMVMRSYDSNNEENVNVPDLKILPVTVKYSVG